MLIKNPIVETWNSAYHKDNNLYKIDIATCWKEPYAILIQILNIKTVVDKEWR